MSESQKAMESLAFWNRVFAICFIVFGIVISIMGVMLAKSMTGINQCMAIGGHYADSKCYLYDTEIQPKQ